MEIKHKIISADATFGQIQVRYYTDENPVGFVYAIDVPIVDGAFISGAVLTAEIESRSPTWALQRISEVATAPGFAAIAQSVEVDHIAPNGSPILDQPTQVGAQEF